ncbi:MAG: hypothetical protein HYX43_10565 [Burkholderiales bacterium]|nr:hypothetical protein [Burkholderiales bacterium]
MSGVLTYAASEHSDQAAPVEQQPAQAAEPAKPAQQTGEPQAAQTDESVPANIKELREKDDARRMFGAQSTYKETIPIGESWPEQNKAAAREWREVLADTEISPADARELVGVVQGLKELPSAETKVEWEKAAHDELQRTYGADADQALADAQALVARDPRVQAFLYESKLGSHPDFVRHIVRLARQQRARGRL